jgi:hypothetical protein
LLDFDAKYKDLPNKITETTVISWFCRSDPLCNGEQVRGGMSDALNDINCIEESSGKPSFPELAGAISRSRQSKTTVCAKPATRESSGTD